MTTLRVCAALLAMWVVDAAGASTTESIPLKLQDGTPISASVKRPKAIKPEKLPVFLIFGGFEEASKVLSLIDPPIPSILASFDYPFSGNRKFVFPESLRDIPRFKASIDLTLEAIDALVTELIKRPDVDKNRIAIVGASFGAPFAVRAAARNPELDALIIVHGFADVPKAIEHRLNQLWLKKLGRLTPIAAWLVSRGAKLYLKPPEPGEDGQLLHAHQRALMVEAVDDTLIPRESREKLLRAIEASPAKTHHLPMPGDHLQPGSDALIRDIMRRTIEWLAKQGW